MNDRFELFLEKATEIESMKSRLLYAIARSVINNERFDKIILAAMKQSNELYFLN
jgi:16S rRNA (uracil1498-N3)-methyltransferase